MSSILDLITGGALLPYVYCKNVTLENSNGGTEATLLLELYQDKNALSNSTWLNDLSVGGMNFLDAMYIQILPFTKYENVVKLRPSYSGEYGDPLSAIKSFTPGDDYVAAETFPGSIYAAKNVLGDNYLPRAPVMNNEFTYVCNEWDPIEGICWDDTGTGAMQPTLSFSPLAQTIPLPIQISNSSILGNLAGSDALLQFAGEGKVREEIIDGKPYYAIPFEYKYTISDVSSTSNLGFAFYSFLHTPSWVSQLAENLVVPEAFFEQYVVEGPINTEIVFLNGEVPQKKEGFFLPDGKEWHGSVHLHATGMNADPTGYAGDGGLSGPTAPYRGWMAGDKHLPGAPKLRLAETPNNKISDFRHGVFPVPLDTAFGINPSEELPLLNQGINKIEEFLSPFQKEKRKDLTRDNDSEYSKLYVCRDKDNNARGMFFIDALELLLNNSNLFGDPVFSNLKENEKIDFANLDDQQNTAITEILNKSRVLELKVYRDRVNKHVLNTRYENYSNDKSYEEPSQLIGTISDGNGWKTAPSQNGALEELTGLPDELNRTRYFVFTDRSVGEKTAGLYQYRVVLDFKDGTYEYLYELYKDLAKVKMELDTYYNLAISSYSAGEITANSVTGEYKKAVFKNYYQNGAFVPEFIDILITKFNLPLDAAPWDRAPYLLQKIQDIFGTYTNKLTGQNLNFLYDQTIRGMVSPFHPDATGAMVINAQASPKGIEFFSRLVGTAIKKLQSLIDATKINKTGSELNNNTVPDGYSLNSQLDVVISPSDSMIKEEYTFDHPSELFEAVDNENIYIDYLSSQHYSLPMSTLEQGIRTIPAVDFKKRCQQDAAKFVPMALYESHFRNSPGSGGSIGPVQFPFGPGGSAVIPSDSLSNTAFSYLTPQIIELSDPLDDTYVYNFYYKAYKSGYYHSEQFLDYENYDKLFMSLLNYSLSKVETADADLTDAYIDPNNIIDSDEIVNETISYREPFKRAFEKLGITFHDSANYEDFFDDPSAGPGTPGTNLFPLKIEEYSDGLISPKAFFKNFLYDPNQPIIPIEKESFTPSGYSWSADLPNSFKIGLVQKNHEQYNLKKSGIPGIADFGIVHEDLQEAYGLDDNFTFSTFFFFNVNLTVKVEYFSRGNPGISKDDEAGWSLLTENAIDTNDKLFCRLSLYNEKLKRNIRIPMLDKYFLIQGEGTQTQTSAFAGEATGNGNNVGEGTLEDPVVEYLG